MRHVFETMGTVASLQLPGEFTATLPAIEQTFREIEDRFSLYLPDSELSRVARGDLRLTEASEVLIDTYARALDWRELTGGAFTAHRPDGIVDLNGIVKADAIDAAGRLLDEAGCSDWCINVGGDLLIRSTAVPDPIGIVDPQRRGAILCAIVPRHGRRALATSGSAERGDHIWRGGSTAPTQFVQVSVLAGDIVTADVLATAIVSGGPDALAEFTERWPIDVLTVDRAGDLLATPGMRDALAM